MTIFWLITFLILITIEILTINLVTIWFAIGALTAAIVSCFTTNLFLEFIVFVLISGICLLFTKPFLNRVKQKPKIPTNLDSIIGKIGQVTEEIDPEEVGEVKVAGKRWSAISKERIPKWTFVVIKKITGVKVVVEKKEEN